MYFFTRFCTKIAIASWRSQRAYNCGELRVGGARGYDELPPAPQLHLLAELALNGQGEQAQILLWQTQVLSQVLTQVNGRRSVQGASSPGQQPFPPLAGGGVGHWRSTLATTQSRLETAEDLIQQGAAPDSEDGNTETIPHPDKRSAVTMKELKALLKMDKLRCIAMRVFTRHRLHAGDLRPELVWKKQDTLVLGVISHAISNKFPSFNDSKESWDNIKMYRRDVDRLNTPDLGSGSGTGAGLGSQSGSNDDDNEDDMVLAGNENGDGHGKGKRRPNNPE
ncbi:hypothetical protein DFH08DRAFT_827426 [Mycena albidolilacea]|uniref:Uncharacterized protein n=1 Tax=Mycena albidolilacea TaxID=1033008 RepID=A0AAD7E7B5_9AGAR|nr:hypothetical protein DFH08DRAFT_827426 [Mycena albidolilacea]